MSAIQVAAELLGGYEATGRVCEVSGKAVRKWVCKGRLPRTEWTGETHYAPMILAALHARGHGDRLTLSDLRALPGSEESAA